jgi:hypothetical protein
VTDSRRLLYAKIGLARYLWWLAFASVGKRLMVPGRYEGVRWRLAVVSIWLGGLST